MSFAQRNEAQILRNQAAALGMTVQQYKEMQEDNVYRHETKDIEAQEQAETDAAAESNWMMEQEYDKRVIGEKERNQYGLDPERFKRRGQEGIPISELISNQQGRQANQAERRKWEMEKLGIGDPDDPAETGHMINEILPGLHKSRYLGPGSNTRKDVAGENELDRMSRSRAGQDVAESGFLGEETFQPTHRSERIAEGQEAAKSDFLGEEAPPWEENPANPEVQERLRQEELQSMEGEIAAGEQSDQQEQLEEGFMPEEPDPAVSPDSQLDETDPAKQQMKEVQNKPEEREAMFEGMSKEDKAFAKEELGNYYVGAGGYAINLDTVDADAQRGANFSLLQHFPPHQRPHMLCKWGYIDPEDCKKLPESDLVKTEEMKMSTKIAVNEMTQKETTKRTRLTTASAELQTGMTTKTKEIIAKGAYDSAENVATIRTLSDEKVTGMGLDFKELERKSLDLIAMNDVEVKKYIADEQNKVSYRKIDEHTKNLTSQLNSNENIAKWGNSAKSALAKMDISAERKNLLSKLSSDKLLTELGISGQAVLQAKSIEGQYALQTKLKQMGVEVSMEEIKSIRENLATQLNSDKTLKEMGINGAKFLQGDQQEHQKWIKTQQGKIDMATINMTKEHFKKQIEFDYKKLEGVERFKAASLAQMGAKQLMEFKLKSTAQQQSEILNKHKMGMSRLKVLMDNGQVEASMYQAHAMGMPWATDVKAFWRSRAKDAPIDNPEAMAEFKALGYSGTRFSAGIDKYLGVKGGVHKKFMSEKPDEDGLRPIEAFVKNNQNSINFRDDPLGPAWSNMSGEQQKEWNENKGGYAGWKATMVQKAVNYEMQQDPTWSKVAGAFQNKDLKDRMNADDSKAGPKTEEVQPPAKTAVTAETPAQVQEPVAKQKKVMPSMSNIEDELNKRNPTPEKMQKSFEKGEGKFNSILKAEGKIMDKRRMKFNNKDELLDYFESKPELLSQPASIGDETIGSGISGVFGTKKNTLNLQHYVLKELEKRSKEFEKRNRRFQGSE